MALTNPFHSRTCPACGQKYYPGNCAIVSSIPSGMAPLTYPVLKPASPSFLSRPFVTPLTGKNFTKKMARLQCPNSACGKLLPRSDTFTIAIVGDVQSGKSHFIASCINQLKRHEAWQVIGCTKIVGQDNTEQRYYREYYEPVYQRLEQIKPTQAARNVILEPLVYEVVFKKKARFSSPKTITLLFYDSSGEDVTRPDRIISYGHYVLDAAAVIFLADPLLMPGIIKKLPSSQQPPSTGIIQMRTYDVLNRVIQTLEQSKGLNPGEQLKTPIAITISKSDLLKYVVHDALFLKPSVLGKNLDTREFEIIDREVRDLIQEHGDIELITSSETFEKKIFLAVSPTGWPADGSGGFPKIESLRCFDPMLWALWQLKLITSI